MSAGMTQMQIINAALDSIPAKGITAFTDNSESARSAARWYDVTLRLCLRRGLMPWGFATTRIQLAANSNTPVNEFQYEYDLPGNCLAIQRIWPDVPYRKEENKLYTNASTVVLKYTNDDCVSNAGLMDIEFAKFFWLSLAAAMAPKLAEDPARKKTLSDEAEIQYRHASASMSMEDTPDPMPDGPWIQAHEGIGNYISRTDSLLDWNSLP